jgi:hypothetical protein
MSLGVGYESKTLETEFIQTSVSSVSFFIVVSTA